MAYIYPLNNPGGVHLTVFDFTHLSPPPTYCMVSGETKKQSNGFLFPQNIVNIF